MNLFYVEKNASYARMKRLLKYVKKQSKFGAYAEVTEQENQKYDVELFCPKIHTDYLGNRAIVPNRSARMRLDDVAC